MPVPFTYSDDQLYTFPRDPEQRLYTAQDLFALAAIRVINRDGLGPTEDIPLLDVLDVIDEGFADGTVVPAFVVSLN